MRGFKATAQAYGYGRWFRFANAQHASWFGVNHYRWGASGRTPLWVRIHEQGMRVRIDDTALFKVRRGDYWWLPIDIKTGVLFDAVLAGVAAQQRQLNAAFGRDTAP